MSRNSSNNNMSRNSSFTDVADQMPENGSTNTTTMTPIISSRELFGKDGSDEHENLNPLLYSPITSPLTPSSPASPFILCPFAYKPTHGRQRRHSSHEAMTITDIEDEGDSLSCFISNDAQDPSITITPVPSNTTTNNNTNNISLSSSCLYSSLMMNRRLLVKSDTPNDAMTPYGTTSEAIGDSETSSLTSTAASASSASSASKQILNNPSRPMLRTHKHARKCTLLRPQRSSWHAQTKHSSSANRLLDFQMQRQPVPLRNLLLGGHHHDVTLEPPHQPHKHHQHHNNHQHHSTQHKSSTISTSSTTYLSSSVKTRRSNSNSSSGIPSQQPHQESDTSDSRSLTTEESISVRSFDSSLDEPATSPFAFLHDFSPVVNTSSTTTLFKPYNHDSRYKREGAGFSESEIAALLLILFIKMILFLVHIASPKFSEWIRKCCFS